MESITLLITIAASALIFMLAPVRGLIVYIATFAWYPTYLSVQMGTLDFTVRRLVIIALLTKIFFMTNLTKQFRLIWLDKLVLIYFVSQLLSGVITAVSFSAFIENRGGAVFDMLLPYFVIRMIVQYRWQYITILKGILIISIPLAIIGLYQCLTGNNPAGFLMDYSAWDGVLGPMRYTPTVRAGFYRANVVFSHSIMYGLFFAMFGAACTGILYNLNKHKKIYWTCLGLMSIGVFSSMSSGPWLSALLAILFIIFYRWRKYWKPVVIIIIVMCSLVELMSNRHFYNVLGDFTLNSRTAWYRSRLIDVALFEGGMYGHWLTGFGLVDPGWGPQLDGRNHTDMVNHYIKVLYRFGLVGFIPFLAINFVAIKRLCEAFRISTSESEKWLIWCLAGSLFGLSVAFMSVSLFGPPTTIYYMMIGFCGALPIIIKKTSQNLIGH